MLNLNSENVYIDSWIKTIICKLKKQKSFGLINSLIAVILGSLLLIISSKIKIPLYPVPMTLQPLAVLLIGMLYGRNLATLTVGFYIFQGILGLPVFANGGGLLYILGPTGGFIFGFFVAAIVLGELADRSWGKSYITSLISMVIGLFLIYFFGIFQLSLINGFDYAIVKGFLPFIVGDAYKMLLAGIIIPSIWKLAK